MPDGSIETGAENVKLVPPDVLPVTFIVPVNVLPGTPRTVPDVLPEKVPELKEENVLFCVEVAVME